MEKGQQCWSHPENLILSGEEGNASGQSNSRHRDASGGCFGNKNTSITATSILPQLSKISNCAVFF